MDKFGALITISVLLGSLARIYSLRVDYRQYPSYPHSYLTHLTLGFIAAALGALAIPALLGGDYVAVTFLVLAAQQFRDIRNIERQTLAEIEATELVPRGKPYIEGIAKVFESRNYIAMLTAFISSLVIHFVGLIPGILAGLAFIFIMNKMMKGPQIQDIAEVQAMKLTFQGKNMGIEDVVIMNLGEDEAVEVWKKHGIGLAVMPKDDNARATLANTGQRQAILHNLATQMGVRLDVGVQQYSPLARLDLETGRVFIIIIPIEPDVEYLVDSVRRVPVLESVQRKPLASRAGRQAAD